MLSVQAADFRARLESSIVKSKGLCLVVSDWHKSYLASLSYSLKGLWGVEGSRCHKSVSLFVVQAPQGLAGVCPSRPFPPVTKYLVTAARENSISGQLYF